MKALIFDLDGSRQPSMSGGLFKRAVMRELGCSISLPRLEMLDKRHAEFVPSIST